MDEENEINNEETGKSVDFLSVLLTKRAAKIVFTAAVILLLLIGTVAKTAGSSVTEPQNNVTAVSDTDNHAESESGTPQGNGQEKKSKTTMDYLRELHIGKSNLAAIAILGGALAYMQIKRELAEKQKESKYK